jgi:hypothetical protein
MRTARKRYGGKGIRTPDLRDANATLSQLSYTPALREKYLSLNELPLQPPGRRDRGRPAPRCASGAEQKDDRERCAVDGGVSGYGRPE